MTLSPIIVIFSFGVLTLVNPSLIRVFCSGQTRAVLQLGSYGGAFADRRLELVADADLSDGLSSLSDVLDLEHAEESSWIQDVR